MQPASSDAPAEAYDASDPKAIRRKEIDRDLRAEGIRNWLVESVQNPAARNWFFDLLARGHAFETSFVPGSSDSTAFREGERNVVLAVLSQLSTETPEALLQILREQGRA